MPARELTPAELARRCDAASLQIDLPLPAVAQGIRSLYLYLSALR